MLRCWSPIARRQCFRFSRDGAKQKNKFPNLKKDRWIARRLANNRFICTYVSRNCRCQRVTAASSAIANWGLPEVRFWFSRFQPFFWANYRQLISAWSGIHDVERGTGKPPKMIIIIHCPMSARCFFPIICPAMFLMFWCPSSTRWGLHRLLSSEGLAFSDLIRRRFYVYAM